MRLLALGDIHGSFRPLAALAAAVPIRPDDILVTLGDYVSRGPDTRAVLDWLLEREESGPLVALRGNHEVMLLGSPGSEGMLNGWLNCGGDATLKSYARPGRPGSLADIPADHWQFLYRTRPYHETARHFFVHANARPELPLAEQPDDALYWQFFRDGPPAHQSGKVMVCGHSVQQSGRPKSVGHAVCIDTGAGFPGGWLTCLDVDAGRYWQANDHGSVREGWLDDAR